MKDGLQPEGSKSEKRDRLQVEVEAGQPSKGLYRNHKRLLCHEVLAVPPQPGSRRVSKQAGPGRRTDYFQIRPSPHNDSVNLYHTELSRIFKSVLASITCIYRIHWTIADLDFGIFEPGP